MPQNINGGVNYEKLKHNICNSDKTNWTSRVKNPTLILNIISKSYLMYTNNRSFDQLILYI